MSHSLRCRRSERGVVDAATLSGQSRSDGQQRQAKDTSVDEREEPSHAHLRGREDISHSEKSDANLGLALHVYVSERSEAGAEKR